MILSSFHTTGGDRFILVRQCSEYPLYSMPGAIELILLYIGTKRGEIDRPIPARWDGTDFRRVLSS